MPRMHPSEMPSTDPACLAIVGPAAASCAAVSAGAACEEYVYGAGKTAPPAVRTLQKSRLERPSSSAERDFGRRRRVRSPDSMPQPR